MDNILSALEHLNCADLDHAGWVTVGMALKAEGYDVSVWDNGAVWMLPAIIPANVSAAGAPFAGIANP